MRIVVVYQREPHARQLAFDHIEQPRNRAERVALATRMLTDLNLDAEVWIDDQGDQSRALFGDLPDSAIVIGPEGTIHVKLPWYDPKVVRDALPRVPKPAKADAQPPADEQFLRRIASGEPLPMHHRHTMLAHLYASHPGHADAQRWLDELAADGPPAQREWAQQRMQHTVLVDADEKDAIAAAVTEGKLLLYAFTGFNCGTCRIMEERTFRADGVREAMRTNLVELRLHTDAQANLNDERFAANRALQERLAKTRGIPCYVVVDPANGAVVDTFRLDGGFGTWKDKWLEFVTDVAKETGRAKADEKR